MEGGRDLGCGGRCLYGVVIHLLRVHVTAHALLNQAPLRKRIRLAAVCCLRSFLHLYPNSRNMCILAMTIIVVIPIPGTVMIQITIAKRIQHLLHLLTNRNRSPSLQKVTIPVATTKVPITPRMCPLPRHSFQMHLELEYWSGLPSWEYERSRGERNLQRWQLYIQYISNNSRWSIDNNTNQCLFSQLILFNSLLMLMVMLILLLHYLVFLHINKYKFIYLCRPNVYQADSAQIWRLVYRPVYSRRNRQKRNRRRNHPKHLLWNPLLSIHFRHHCSPWQWALLSFSSRILPMRNSEL